MLPHVRAQEFEAICSGYRQRCVSFDARSTIFQLDYVPGLAGLTAAYLLSSSGARTGLPFDVHMFEKVSV